MINIKRRLLLIILLMMTTVLSSCTYMSAFKQNIFSLGGRIGGNSYGANGNYKIGKPYFINSKKYIPKIDYNYDKVGFASWYGAEAAGNLTANGATYNMYKISAANKTLPLPSIVKVTNLENGRVLKVKVNDRGPYVNNRIIDLSYQAAKLLDIYKKGVVKVRVQVIAKDSKLLREYLLSNGERGKNMLSPFTKISQKNFVKTKVKVVNKVHHNKDVVDTKNSTVWINTVNKKEYTNQSGDIYQTKTLPTKNIKIFLQFGIFQNKNNSYNLLHELQGLQGIKNPFIIKNSNKYLVLLGPITNYTLATEIQQYYKKKGFVSYKLFKGK